MVDPHKRCVACSCHHLHLPSSSAPPAPNRVCLLRWLPPAIDCGSTAENALVSPREAKFLFHLGSLINCPSPKDASCRCRIIRSVPPPAWIWLCNTCRQWCWPSSAIGGPDGHNPSVSSLAAAAWQVPAHHRYAHLSYPSCGSMLTRSRSPSRSLLQSSFLT
jgi:hypothetical protein